MAAQAHHSSSSSSSSSRLEYQVFLSFRGKDTRKTFTGHLYHALVDKGVRTFIDNKELRTGKEIGPALITAIQQSRISIPVFSKKYASSKWCLQELVKILQCHKTNDQIVLPIFYHVKPSNVRNQTGSFRKALRKHRKNSKPEIVDDWREALKEVGKLKGWDLEEIDNGNESKLVRLVVKRVLSELNTIPLVVAKHPIGLDSHVEKLLSLLHVESTDPQFVAICGMGGIGKTTMVKVIYNQIFQSFDGSSFLADVREEASKHKGLLCLQNQLLTDILGKQNQAINHVYCGSKLIEERLQGKTVLIILDDVDNCKQLNSLAGALNWFGPRSKIIITRRDEQVFGGVAHLDDKNIYKPEGLDDHQSLLLFSMHAFGRIQPPIDYMKLSREVVHYARGLPLTLEVLGSSLCNREKEEWKSVLEKLEKVPHEEVQNKLKISYDGLNKNQKDIFLDTSCFFIGMYKDLAIAIWEGCGFFPKIELKALIRKSLIRIGEDSKLRMHDQLRDMGRKIVYEESPKEPREYSKLWYKGTREIEDIFHDHMWRHFDKSNFLWEKPAFTKDLLWEIRDCVRVEDLGTMSKLRLLLLKYLHIEGNIEFLPSSLKWLSLEGCSLEILPPNFCLRGLVGFELSKSKITEAWSSGLQNKRFENLKFLNLSECVFLAKSPDFSGFPQLEILILEDCESLVEVHESIGQLNRLIHLNLAGTKLMSLPYNICTLHSLQKLILNHCFQLVELPESIGDLKSLIELDLNGTSIEKLPSSIEMLSTLGRLLLSHCVFIWRFSKSMGRIRSLVELNLFCTSIAEIPGVVGQLEKLKILNVASCTDLEFIVELPTSLISLDASDCKSLKSLPNLSNLKNLRTLLLWRCLNLDDLQGLEGADSLEELDVTECMNLTDTPMEVLVQESFNSQPFSLCEIQSPYEINDDVINNGMIMWLVFEFKEEVHIVEEEDEILKFPLRIEARIQRNGKRITCRSSLDIRLTQITPGEITSMHHFQGANWFGFPLKCKDEIKIVDSTSWYIRPFYYKLKQFLLPNLKYFKILPKEMEHIQQPGSQKLIAEMVEVSFKC